MSDPRYLTSVCAICPHTYNWHASTNGSCAIDNCGCQRFVDPEHEQTWPMVLPDGQTAFCPVDAYGRIDPREAYAPWLRRITTYHTTTPSGGTP
ncbi:hypothetical protein PJN38_24280 [Mycobacterium kansasii]